MKCLFVILLVSISSKQLLAQYSLKHFNRLRQLEGSWQIKKASSTTYEVWTIANDSTFTAVSYQVAGTDTTWLESVALILRSGTITYTPTTLGQNDGQPVTFTLRRIIGSKFVFENKKHDFPQVITYQMLGKNSLHASISGPGQGGIQTIHFPFSRPTP